MAERQQILHLWLAAAALDTEVVAWSVYGESDTSERAGAVGGPGEQPYRTGVEALYDGWLLLQAPGPIDVAASNGELGCEFVFERRAPLD